MGVSQSRSGGVANKEKPSRSGVISAKGMYSQFEALYSAYIIVRSFIPFQTGSGLSVALDMAHTGYCRYPLVPPMLYVIDF